MKHTDRQSQPPWGNYRLHPLDFEILRDIIHETSGIFFHDNKRPALESRVLPRLKALAIDCFEDYIAYATEPGNYSEILRLIDCVTPITSSFFHTKEQFDCIEHQILPSIAKQKKLKGAQNIKIWCSACATGEEAFSIAMIAQSSLLARDSNINVEIIGSDINTNALYHAECGWYDTKAVQAVPQPLREAYFTRKDDGYKLSESILDLVTYKRINLADRTDLMRLHEVDLVFCTNVLYLLSAEHKHNLLKAIYNCMNDEAYFMIGATETLFGLPHPFLEIQAGKVKVYQKCVG